MYSHLVTEKYDLSGIIAYGIYKEEKVKFIQQYANEHNGATPSDEDLHTFHTCAELRMNAYREQADSLLEIFSNQIISEYKNDIDSEVKSDYCNNIKLAIEETKLKETIESHKPSGFWYGVWQSTVGAFIFMIAMCALMFLLHFNSSSYSITFGGNGQTDIQQTKQKTK